jgi:ATP-dependent DNA helicase RecQ
LRQVPIVALTATAVPRIQEDIVTNLRLSNPHRLQQSFDRTNLKLRVIRKEGGISAALEPLIQLYKLSGSSKAAQELPKSTIIYAPTRADVEELANFLQHRFAAEGSTVRCEPYHAGLSTSIRQQAHTNFLTGTTDIIVATVAFGMGIDKPDIRRVIHWGPPKSVEEYSQQIGRAGRDGLPAECTLCWESSRRHRTRIGIRPA